jgi:hypothetical protein
VRTHAEPPQVLAQGHYGTGAKVSNRLGCVQPDIALKQVYTFSRRAKVRPSGPNISGRISARLTNRKRKSSDKSEQFMVRLSYK